MITHLAKHGHKLSHLELCEVLAPPQVSLSRLLILPYGARKEVVGIHDHMHEGVQGCGVVCCTREAFSLTEDYVNTGDSLLLVVTFEHLVFCIYECN